MSADAFLRGMQIAQQGAYQRKQNEFSERKLSILEGQVANQNEQNRVISQMIREQGGLAQMSPVPGSKEFDPEAAYQHQLLASPVGGK